MGLVRFEAPRSPPPLGSGGSVPAPAPSQDPDAAPAAGKAGPGSDAALKLALPALLTRRLAAGGGGGSIHSQRSAHEVAFRSVCGQYHLESQFWTQGLGVMVVPMLIITYNINLTISEKLKVLRVKDILLTSI